MGNSQCTDFRDLWRKYHNLGGRIALGSRCQFEIASGLVAMNGIFLPVLMGLRIFLGPSFLAVGC